MFCFGSGAADPAQVQAAGHPRGGGAGGEPDHAGHGHQPLQRVSEHQDPPVRKGFSLWQGFGAGVFGWSRSRHVGPAPAPASILA